MEGVWETIPSTELATEGEIKGFCRRKKEKCVVQKLGASLSGRDSRGTPKN